MFDKYAFLLHRKNDEKDSLILKKKITNWQGIFTE